MARVVLENVSKIYRGTSPGSVHAVSGLCLSVEDRDLLVLLGPSGCGKTTTLRLIAGLEEATQGQILIDGQSVNGVPPQARDIAMVFQHHALYPHMTARENLGFGLKLRKTPRGEIETRIREASEMLGLNECLDRRPAALSGGQRQRVALGRAIVRRPRVFLFDEPLSHLDAQLRTQMRLEITRLHARLGATIIYVTHDHHEALALGTRVAVMNEGRLQQVATPMELYRKPANLFVAGFIGSPPMNLFHGVLARNGQGLYFEEQVVPGSSSAGFKLRLADDASNQLEAKAGHKIVLGLRPEHISVNQTAAPGEIAEASAEAIESIGADVHLRLASAGHHFVARVPASCTAASLQKVALRFDLEHAIFFDATTGELLALAWQPVGKS